MLNSERDSITLREARPTLDEGLKFARYLDVASEGFFRFMLGRRMVEIVAEAYLQPGNDFSYHNVIFAEKAGSVVGMASGYTGEQHGLHTSTPFEVMVGSLPFRAKVIAFLFAPLFHVLDSIPEGDFYLQSIGVDDDFRGQGIGSILLDAVEERAFFRGANRLSLDVSGKNPGARRLYERRGMRVESRWPKHLWIPGIRLLRMAKPLS